MNIIEAIKSGGFFKRKSMLLDDWDAKWISPHHANYAFRKEDLLADDWEITGENPMKKYEITLPQLEEAWLLYRHFEDFCKHLGVDE